MPDAHYGILKSDRKKPAQETTDKTTNLTEFEYKNAHTGAFQKQAGSQIRDLKETRAKKRDFGAKQPRTWTITVIN